MPVASEEIGLFEVLRSIAQWPNICTHFSCYLRSLIVAGFCASDSLSSSYLSHEQFAESKNQKEMPVFHREEKNNLLRDKRPASEASTIDGETDETFHEKRTRQISWPHALIDKFQIKLSGRFKKMKVVKVADEQLQVSITS